MTEGGEQRMVCRGCAEDGMQRMVCCAVKEPFCGTALANFRIFAPSVARAVTRKGQIAAQLNGGIAQQ